MTDNRSLRILFVSSEVTPFAKTGGLADVAAALPRALGRLGHDVRIAMPLYGCADVDPSTLRPVVPELLVRFDGDLLRGRVLEGRLPRSDVPVYFVDHPGFFDRAGLYGDDSGDYHDNGARFGFFCVATAWLARMIGWAPEVVHCNDWQTGLVPTFLRELPNLRSDPFFVGTRTVFTVHNLAYQGLFPPEFLDYIGLPRTVFHPAGLEYWGLASLVKAGIAFSDWITTVSPEYAREIQTPEFGCRLEGMLQSRSNRLRGILNGIDPEEWNPADDPLIEAAFSADDPSGKTACKEALQAEMGLPVEPDKPLIGMVTRLDWQKGIDLLEAALPELLDSGAQFVILGTGDPGYHGMLERAERRAPQALRVRLEFDAHLAHAIFAGSDALLMPSRYEPCGLSQLYALRYGTVPIVRRTGGLTDTVVPANRETLLEGTATGFVFELAAAGAMIDAVQAALEVYTSRPDQWSRLRDRGMRQDFSWDRSAREYERLYLRALNGGR